MQCSFAQPVIPNAPRAHLPLHFFSSPYICAMSVCFLFVFRCFFSQIYLALIHVINLIVFIIFSFVYLQIHHSSFNRQDLRRNHHRLVRQSVKDVRKYYSAMRQVSATTLSMQRCNSNRFICYVHKIVFHVFFLCFRSFKHETF